MKNKMEEITRTKDITTSEFSNYKNNNQNKKRKNLKNKLKLFIVILTFIFSFSICFLSALKTFEKEKNKPINYLENNNVEYKVYLNKNDFYHEEYLEMNRAYVASLINHIDIDFNYAFKIEKATNMKFDYKIIANLIIENKNGTNYVDENYIIKDSTIKNIDDCRDYSINELVTIDYAYYNNLANKFRSQTGVDVNSYLNVYMLVNTKTDDNTNYNINKKKKKKKLVIKIPLSERALEIKLDTSNQTSSKKIMPTGNIKFNIKYLILEIIFGIISCILDLKIIKYIFLLKKPTTAYDRYIKKILKDYDRLIVESKTIINFNNYKIIDVKSFTELLDVRDNLKLPIIYNNLEEHEKGIFYIKHTIDIYRLIVNNKDLESKKF